MAAVAIEFRAQRETAGSDRGRHQGVIPSRAQRQDGLSPQRVQACPFATACLHQRKKTGTRISTRIVEVIMPPMTAI